MTTLRSIVTLVTLAALAFSVSAQEPAWQPLLNDLPKTEKAAFGGLCGIALERSTGNLFINISDRGFYRSTDTGKTFQRISNTQPKGRTESPGCLHFDPTGKSKTLFTALVYGDPVSTSNDGGATWTAMDKKSGHVDWAAVDWTDPDRKFVLALKHEAGGLLLASHDAGKSFEELGKGYGTGWVFDGKTAVVAEAKSKDKPKPNLMRTTDAGKSWTPCSSFSPAGSNSAQALPKWIDGKLYWLVDGALIVTADRGESWQKVCDLKDGRYGPIAGKTTTHLFVLTAAGIRESTDGGTTWMDPIPLPKEVKGGGLTWFDYHPMTNTLFAMKMGSDLFKLTRK